MSPNKEMNGRRGKGRKKIEIKPIKNAGSRKVCFSKRRQGLFNKANELCIVCGTEVAILVFSPAGKPFSYGHPSMENVVNRFLNDGAAVPPKATPAAAAPDRCDEIKQSLTYWTDCLETEKRRRSQLEAALKEPWPVPKPFWWDADLCSMSMPELIDYQNVLQQQQFHVAQAERQLCFPDPAAAAPQDIGNEFADAGPILDCMPGGAAEFGEADLMSWLQPQVRFPQPAAPGMGNDADFGVEDLMWLLEPQASMPSLDDYLI
ncbi:Agamous-like MADS-box protein AGL61 [Platanthera zijinensis]|uniref:Agamous-like MADS-box protein AGL61 n=1 Tax=Platanthera zijinensis TaxID=2320716 RepID=A0AAP0BYY0_9ASPA